MLERFMAGKEEVMVATSALGIGIDIPDIREIIHVNQPRSLLEHAQESGRAGRNGRRSEAIMIWEGEAAKADEEVQEEERRLVEQFMGIGVGKGEERVCRRVVLDGYLDERRERFGCEEGEEGCDVCSRISWEIEEQRPGIQQKERQEIQQKKRQEIRQEQERQKPRRRFIQEQMDEFTALKRIKRQFVQ